MTDRALKLAQTVAPRLDGAWRFNRLASENHNWNYFVLTDDATPGRQIEIAPYTKYGDQRLEIFGRLDRLGAHSQRSQTITVSQNRSPHSIAADINRRLLPGYLDDWIEREAYIEKSGRESTEHGQKIDLLRRVAPELRASDWREIDNNTTEFRFQYGSVQMWRSYHKTTVTLDLSFAETLQVLHFVNEMKEKNNA